MTRHFAFPKTLRGVACALALLALASAGYAADTIASVKAAVAAGTAGTTTFTLTGYVGARNLWSSSSYEIALQDRIDGSAATRGLVVYDNHKTGYGSRTALPPVGAQVTVTGTATSYGGMVEFLPTAVYADDATTRTITPRAVRLSDINDNTECVLCKVYGIHFTTDTAKTVYTVTTGSNLTIAASKIADGLGTSGSSLYFPKYLGYETNDRLTGFDASTATGSPYFDMVGLAQQYDGTNPLTGGAGYEFTPRYEHDIVGNTHKLPDSIASVKAAIAAGTAGTTTFTLAGYVSARNLWSSSSYEVALQSDLASTLSTRGLLVYDHSKIGYGSRTALPPPGALMTVTGTAQSYGGMVEFVPTALYSDDATTRSITPMTVRLDRINDNTECVLCKVYGIHFTTDTAKSVYTVTTGSNLTIAANKIADGDGGTGASLYFPKYLGYETRDRLTGFDATTATGFPYFNMVGLAQQYDGTNPLTGGAGYEFTPRYQSDIAGDVHMLPVELSSFGVE